MCQPSLKLGMETPSPLPPWLPAKQGQNLRSFLFQLKNAVQQFPIQAEVMNCDNWHRKKTLMLKQEKNKIVCLQAAYQLTLPKLPTPSRGKPIETLSWETSSNSWPQKTREAEFDVEAASCFDDWVKGRFVVVVVVGTLEMGQVYPGGSRMDLIAWMSCSWVVDPYE